MSALLSAVGHWLCAFGAVSLFAAALPFRGPDDGASQKPPLRVCADPNDLPFSNEARAGFENAIAELLARDLGTTVQYVWYPERSRSFLRRTINAGRCDLIMGMPASDDRVETTRPYYRSTYVFVSRADRRYDLHSLDDPRLRHLRIGIHIIGDDYANTPGSEALAARHIVNNVVGYSVYGNYAKPNPEARLVDAVARGDIDVAIVWGPLAGYFAPRESARLALAPVMPARDSLSTDRFVFDIAMAVPRGDRAAAELVDSLIDRERPVIDGILRRYGVPDVRSSARQPGVATRPRESASRLASTSEESGK